MPQRKESWWKKRTNLERQLAIVGSISLVIALALLFRTIFLKKIETKQNDIDDLCLTHECIDTASQIYRNLDETVNPCTDFYRFACGDYMKHSLIPNDKTFTSNFASINDLLEEQIKSSLEENITDTEPKAFRMAKKYYRACTNKTLIEQHGLKTAQQLLSRLGGWPVVEEIWNEQDFDWIEFMMELKKIGFSTNGYLEISVGLDFKNSSEHLIHIDQPSFGLNREYLVNGLNDKIVKAYYDYMVDLAVMFGADGERAMKELHDSLRLEIDLATISLSQESRRNVTNLYNLMTIDEMEKRFLGIPWLKLINGILPKNVQVNKNQSVLVGVPEYLKYFENLIAKTPTRIQANYLFWRIVKDLTFYLDQKVRDRELIFNHVVNGIQENPPRWKECVEETTSLIPTVIGAIYVRKYFHVEAKTNALEMVRYIKNQFKAILRNITWMDEETRKSALDKADTIVDHIAYPDELLDDKKIEETCSHLEIDENQFLYSALNISKYVSDQGLSRLHQPVNKTDWREHGFPAQVNAFYHPLENSITFPAGILQDIFFNKDRPRYMNFGAIGSVIGHEITHGFDDTGRQFDKNGNLVNWWKDETKSAFLERAQCVIDQYDQYVVPDIKMKLNGFKTQGENIADNGGVKQAYLAYLNWTLANGEEKKLPGLKYTPRQLFWISAAQIWCSKHRNEAVAWQVTVDVHSPAEFRVQGPFSNLNYFAKDYNCPVGSRMNPQHKCTVW